LRANTGADDTEDKKWSEVLPPRIGEYLPYGIFWVQKWFQNLRSGSRARRKTPEASCATYEKAQSRLWRDEQYILKRFATQLLGLRWGFETTSNHS